MASPSDLWQLLFIDALFLLTAAGIGLWFRAWLQRQGEAFDRRLAALEAQQAGLERLGQRLSTALEALDGPPRRPQGVRPAGRRGSARREDGLHERARTMLLQGVPAGEVARSLDMSIADVEVLRRVLRHSA